MTRREFVIGYAERSGLSARFARVGLIDGDNQTMVAMPCGCVDPECCGWVMLAGGNVLDHLQLHAPEGLRDAYARAVNEAGGE